MNKTALIERIKTLDGLTNDEKSALLGLLRSHKKFGLVWEDKPENTEEYLKEAIPVLTEVKDFAIISNNHPAPNHIIVEGDNLGVLTTLSYTHEGKIDVIYIDPPYNTGKKDFIYNDTYVDTEDAFRHSKWLSFMHKRLVIAKRLLSQKGVIFISIDDNEQAQLKLLCDEIWGTHNFLGQIILKTATDNNPSQINTEHEYMLCYAQNKAYQENWKRPSIAAKRIITKYKELRLKTTDTDQIQKELRKWIKENKESLPQVTHYNNVDEKGVYSSSSNSSNPHPGGYDFDILHPITHKPCPKPQNGWRWPYSTFEQYDKAGEIEWGKDETTQPHVKKRIETSMEYLRTLIYEDNRGTTKALADIFNGKKVFDNPKPHHVISRILDFASDKESIVLDFFAGSGTTLHATMQLNADDGGKRQCILATNNENNICTDVTYERNKRIITGYTTPKGVSIDGLAKNNLRYYKTSFISRERSMPNMRKLVSLATDMLCIKEDLYTEVPTFGKLKLNSQIARYFNNGASQMLVIYREGAIRYFVDEIEKMNFNGKLKVYLFAPDRYAFDDDFFAVSDKVQLCALPAAIYDAYQKVLPKRKPKFIEMEEVESTEDVYSDSEEGTLF